MARYAKDSAAAKSLDTESERIIDRAAALRIIRRVLPYFWPVDKPNVKVRVVLSLTVLIIAKVIAVATPFLYKLAVDTLTLTDQSTTWLLSIGTIGLVIAYAVARLTNVLFQQLRDVIFVNVSQGALRALSLQTLTHIHALSMRYHISRKLAACAES